MRQYHTAKPPCTGSRPGITQEGIMEFLETPQRLPIQIERREALWWWQAVLPPRKNRLSA
jgi:hypothetical protein